MFEPLLHTIRLNPEQQFPASQDQTGNLPIQRYAERAVILTEALQAHKSEPYIIAMAHGMADWFRKCPIIIYPNELIVGTLGCTKKNAPIFPEFGVDWLVDEMENGLLGYHPTEHQNDYFSHSEECYQQLKSIQEYWKGNDVLAKLMPLLSEEEIAGSQFGNGVSSVSRSASSCSQLP